MGRAEVTLRWYQFGMGTPLALMLVASLVCASVATWGVAGGRACLLMVGLVVIELGCVQERCSYIVAGIISAVAAVGWAMASQM